MAGVSRGAAGEILAARYLRANGYELIEINHRSRFGEIDIIAECDGYLAFIEVKTRGEAAYYEPREAVTYSKQQKIIRTAMGYLAKHPTDLQPRFDVIEVYMDGSAPLKAKCIEYIENAFDSSGKAGRI